MIEDELRLAGHVRYMDDLVVLAHSQPRLHEALATITEFIETRLRVEQRPERTWLLPVPQGLPWLGFRVFPGVTRLDGRKWARMRRRMRSREAACALRLIGEEELARSVRSMAAHVSHVDSLQVPPPRERGLFIEKQASVVARSPSRAPRVAICFTAACPPPQPQQPQQLRQHSEPPVQRFVSR